MFQKETAMKYSRRVWIAVDRDVLTGWTAKPKWDDKHSMWDSGSKTAACMFVTDACSEWGKALAKAHGLKHGECKLVELSFV